MASAVKPGATTVSRAAPDFGASRLGDHDLQILAGHYQTARAAPIQLTQQRQDVRLQRRLSGDIQRQKRLVGWSVIGLEEFHPMRRRFVAEIEELLARLHDVTGE